MNPEQSVSPGGTQPEVQPSTTPSTEPPKDSKNILIAVVVAIVVIVGVLVFIMLNSNKETTTNSSTNSGSSSTGATTPNTSKYQQYDVTDKLTGNAYSVWFYKNAKVEDKNSRTYLNSGELGSMYSIYLGATTGDKIDCGSTPSTTMKLSGESTTVCYDSNNSQYAGYAKTKDGMVKINLAGQQAISMEDAKTIMESVSFK